MLFYQNQPTIRHTIRPYDPPFRSPKSPHSTMFKYSVASIKALLRPIYNIHGFSQLSSLFQLSQRLIEHLHKVHHPIHSNDGYADYMLSAVAHAFFSTAAWRDRVNVGELFVVLETAITNTEQKTHKWMWQAIKDLQDNFNNVQTALKTIFERIIDHPTIQEAWDETASAQMKP